MIRESKVTTRWARMGTALIACAVFIGGCALPFSAPPKSRKYVHATFAPFAPTEITAAESPGKSAPTGVMLVADIGNSGRGGGHQIVYSRNRGVVQSYQFTFWTRPLQDQFRELLVRRIDQAQLFEGVTTTGSGVIGDYQLNVHITDFFLDLTEDRPQIVSRLRVELIDLFTRRLLRTVNFEQNVPVEDANEIENIVHSFGNAIERLVSFDIVPWLSSIRSGLPINSATVPVLESADDSGGLGKDPAVVQ